MAAENLKRISVGILSATIFFIIGGIAVVILGISGQAPFLNGYYPMLLAAIFLAVIGGILGFLFSKTMSFIICMFSFGSIDIDC